MPTFLDGSGKEGTCGAQASHPAGNTGPLHEGEASRTVNRSRRNAGRGNFNIASAFFLHYNMERYGVTGLSGRTADERRRAWSGLAEENA